MKEFQEIIKEICEELEIKFTLLSEDFIIELEKNNNKKYIYAYKFPLNDQGLGLVLDDKYAFYSVLTNLNIKTIAMEAIFEDYNPEKLVHYLKENKEVIVKSNNGTCGSEVFKINNEKDLFEKVEFLLTKNAPICLSPFYYIKNEYRVIVLNKEVKLLYGKKRPVIVGDGCKTIKTLLEEFNYNYYSVKSNLNKLNLDLTKVLPRNEILEVDFKFNLSKGSTIFSVSDLNMREKLKKIALEVANSLNIQFASIDIIETMKDELLVLEANSGVMMDNFIKLDKDGYKIAKSIYKEAVLTLFKE